MPVVDGLHWYMLEQGSGTTAISMASVSFYLTHNPSALQRVNREVLKPRGKHNGHLWMYLSPGLHRRIQAEVSGYRKFPMAWGVTVNEHFIQQEQCGDRILT